MDFSESPARPGGSPDAMAQSVSCGHSECSERAIVSFDSQFLCLDHLAAHCYSQLQECDRGDVFEQLLTGTGIGGHAARFLDECRTKVAVVLVTRPELPNLERARLLDILLWASELGEKQQWRWPNRRTAEGM